MVCTFSFSTLDDKIARIFEPGAPPPSIRLQVVKQARDAGLWTGVAMMPILPFITDTEEHLRKCLMLSRQQASIIFFLRQLLYLATEWLTAKRSCSPQFISTILIFY